MNARQELLIQATLDAFKKAIAADVTQAELLAYIKNPIKWAQKRWDIAAEIINSESNVVVDERYGHVLEKETQINREAELERLGPRPSTPSKTKEFVL
jgi:hypothetical protein